MTQGIVAETLSAGSVTLQTDRHSKKPQHSGLFAFSFLIKHELCKRVWISPKLQKTKQNPLKHLRIVYFPKDPSKHKFRRWEMEGEGEQEGGRSLWQSFKEKGRKEHLSLTVNDVIRLL